MKYFSYAFAGLMIALGLLCFWGAVDGFLITRDLRYGLVALLLAGLFLVAGSLRLKKLASKTCPACAERIKSDAVKCRYCGTDLVLAPPRAARQF